MAGILEGIIGGLVDGAVGIGEMYLQNELDKQAEQRQVEMNIDAENRANAEYDRRMADERAYNDPTAQAERMRSAGINPMAQLGSGSVSSSTTKASTPTQSSPQAQHRTQADVGLGSAMQYMLAGEQIRGAKLDNDLKERDLFEKSDSYAVRWLGLHADATHNLSQAEREEREAEYWRYKLEWEKKTEKERLEIYHSETYRNYAEGKYKQANTEEQEAMNTQLENWLQYLPESKRAEVEKQLATANSVEDTNKRNWMRFGIMAAALVAGGVAMCVPGGQGVGMALLKTGGAMGVVNSLTSSN